MNDGCGRGPGRRKLAWAGHLAATALLATACGGVQSAGSGASTPSNLATVKACGGPPLVPPAGRDGKRQR